MIREKLITKRHNFNKFLGNLGIAAISIACLFLFIFISSIVIQAIPAFTVYTIKVNLNHSTNLISQVTSNKDTALEIPHNLTEEKSVENFLQNYIESDSKYTKFFSDEATDQIINLVKQNKINQPIEILASSKLNDFLNGIKSNYFNEQDQIFINKLKLNNLLERKFNWNFFFHTESRNAEIAGITTSIIGSLYTIIICILFAFPISICSAIYLEEFAPKNIITSIIEVNINNLAAVPSIVFGLLGLSVLINFFDLPRSTPIVAGITLAMMILPIMIISTRQAISTIPTTIKHAALALGATKIQVIIHHILPLALPGIMTGTILSIARAIGETAPLILIGMVAFIVDIPHSAFDPATVMPVQIFLWTQNPESAFHAKTAAAILVLLCIVIILNIIAVFIRKKYEHRW